MFKFSLVMATALSCISGDDSGLPSYITPCDLTNDFATCTKEQIEKALPEFTKGIPNFGVPSLDPVKLDDIHVNGNGLNLTFSEAQMHGISHSKLSKLKVDIGKDNEAFSLSFIANLSLTAQYVVDGRILVLPIKGQGKSLVKATNVEVQIDSKLNHVKDSKGTHFKLGSPTYKYNIEKTTFKFENLFSGNKQLSDATHQFANENWRQLMDDLAPPVIKQIVKTCVKAINKFFSNVTINKIVKGYKEQ